MRGVSRSVRVVWSAAARREAISARVVGSRSWVSHCWARVSMGWAMAGAALAVECGVYQGRGKREKGDCKGDSVRCEYSLVSATSDQRNYNQARQDFRSHKLVKRGLLQLRYFMGSYQLTMPASDLVFVQGFAIHTRIICYPEASRVEGLKWHAALPECGEGAAARTERVDL